MSLLVCLEPSRERKGLDRLAQSHVVRQEHAGASQLPAGHQPVESYPLMGEERIGVNQFRRGESAMFACRGLRSSLSRSSSILSSTSTAYVLFSSVKLHAGFSSSRSLA